MLILIPSLILFLTAFALFVLQAASANTRAAWLAAVGGAALAFFSALAWLPQTPFELVLPVWKSQAVFSTPISFRADDISFPFALSLAGLTLAVLLTAVARAAQTNWLTWAGSLALGGLGILAVSANNPLTLLLIWSALDTTEALAQMRSARGAADSERIVIGFFTKMLGSGLLLWANTVSWSRIQTFNFDAMSPSASVYLILAAGLRLGVLPLHLPYTNARRGIGTSFRLVSAASSVILLARVSAQSLISPAATLALQGLAIVAALYSAWMWLRAPNELDGRPHWVIGIAALATLSTLSGNPLGAAAWGIALILAGGSLFLSSLRQTRVNRALLLGAWSVSSLPFSLTGAAWLSPLNFFAPLAAMAQAALAAGFIRHALRATQKDALDEQPAWMQTVYLSGVTLLLAMQAYFSLSGWGGARQIGAWAQALMVVFFAAALVWAASRWRIFNPARAHWVGAASSSVNRIYQALWGLYRLLERFSQIIADLLERESGMMWTLLFLILLLAYFTQRGG
ncbi:MAG: hypothetical protein Fur002_18860 [Anaerolineales bacterium]